MPSSPLELRHLRTLLALRDAGSISRAAPRLNLTQSALSHQLKQLESYYGVALFDRKASPLSFSAAGELLLQMAELILMQVRATERKLFRLNEHRIERLRIAVECHTCFDWLMPSMDAYRPVWPAVELDIVSGFHTDPVQLLHQREAELAIVSESPTDDPLITYYPLFTYEIVGVFAPDHAFAAKVWLSAQDFKDETLITYPVPDDMIDVIRQVLRPAGITITRRTSELTVAILQLVASGRGVAALPAWAVAPYEKRRYIQTRPIGEKGLTGQLYAAVHHSASSRAERVKADPDNFQLPLHIAAFIDTIRRVSLANLPGITGL